MAAVGMNLSVPTAVGCRMARPTRCKHHAIAIAEDLRIRGSDIDSQTLSSREKLRRLHDLSCNPETSL